MAGPIKYDWVTIEEQYRAGYPSVREIARHHGCAESTIRKKAAAKGWERDLAEAVREGTRRAIATGGATTGGTATGGTATSGTKGAQGAHRAHRPRKSEDKIIKEAVEQNVRINERHKEELAALDQAEVDVLNSLKDASGDDLKKLQVQASIYRSRAQSMFKRIPLERQCYGLRGNGPVGAVDDDDDKAVTLRIISYAGAGGSQTQRSQTPGSQAAQPQTHGQAQPQTPGQAQPEGDKNHPSGGHPSGGHPVGGQ